MKGELATTIVRAIENAPAAVRALARSWQGVVILVVVVAQLLLPLHYYTVRRDPHDERFAWRMFSPMRMARCTPAFFIDNKPLALDGTFHEAWIQIAARGRFVVIEEMAARVCAQHPGAAVRVEVRCGYLDRPAQTFGGFDMCKIPVL